MVGRTYEEEHVEFLPHGPTHALLHHREHPHEVLRQAGGVTAAPKPRARRPASRRPRTSSVRLACRWLLLWSVLPMAAIRLCTTRRRSISSARLVLLRARTLGPGFELQ